MCKAKAKVNSADKIQDRLKLESPYVQVEWFSWQPTPYHQSFFRALSMEKDIQLRVHFRSRGENSHPWKKRLDLGCRTHYYKKIFGVSWGSLWLALRPGVGHVVVAGWDHPTVWLLLTLLRILHRKYSIWTDTPRPINAKHNVFETLRNTWLRWIFQGADFVCSTGKLGLKRLERMGLSTQKLLNLPFALDPAQYPKWPDLEKKFFQPALFRAISCGRIINSFKGHDLGIRSLKKAFGDRVPWRYCIAGVGPDRNKLEQLVEDLGVKRNVRFLGWVEPERLIRWISSSHFLIHPSPKTDPYPNAVLEGMAAGCVVLASNACGSALDRLSHKKSGLIHRAGNWCELAGQIVWLTKQKKRARQLARAAKSLSDSWPVSRNVKIVRKILNLRPQCVAS